MPKMTAGLSGKLCIAIVTVCTVLFLPASAEAGFNTKSADLVLGQPDFASREINNVVANSLNAPYGVAVDTTSGRLYVCDTSNNRVLWWDDSQSLADGQAPDGVLGQPDFVTSISSCSKTGMSAPRGVAVGASGEIWVADCDNNRVLRFSTPTANGPAASLVLGQPGFTTSDTWCNQTGMLAPYSVAVDSSGSVYVADRGNNRVLVFSGALSNGVPASMVLGQSGYTVKVATCSETGLNGPFGVAVDSSGVLVADTGNNRVVKYYAPLSNNMAAGTVLGQADFSAHAAIVTATGLSEPYSVAVDSSGNVWVSDNAGKRALRYDFPAASGQAANIVIGEPDFTTRMGDTSREGVSSPAGITIDAQGSLWLADKDNSRILKYSSPFSNGQPAALVLGQPDYLNYRANRITANRFNGCSGAAFDKKSGRLYVCDANNHRVLWWNNAASLTNGASADGAIGQADVNSDMPGRSQTGLLVPSGIAVDGDGNLWVADTYNSRVLKFPSPVTTGKLASLVLGQSDYSGWSSDASETGLNAPRAVAVDASGNVWVADNGNNRVLKYTKPSAPGQAASLVLGQTDFSLHAASCTASTMGSPTGVAVDASGNVWVADSYNGRLLKYTVPSTNGQEASLVLGKPDFTSRVNSCTRSEIGSPYSVSIDGNNAVWITDYPNSRVLRFTAPAENGQAADLVLGQADYFSRVSACTETGMLGPVFMAFDGSDNLWLTDSDYNRVTKFNSFRINSVTPVSGGGVVKITDLAGQEFVGVPEVKLVRSGQPDIVATEVSLVSLSKITCSFDLTGKAKGQWDVVVTAGGAGAASTTLAGGFLVTDGNNASGQIDPALDGSVSIQPESGQITVAIPAGSFGRSVTLLLSTTTVPGSSENTVKLTAIGIEITNSLGLQPGKEITLTVYYRDADVAGLEESKLSLARYANGRWVPIPTVVYADQNKLVGTVKHLSTFAVAQLAPAADLAGVRVYPNPFDPKNGSLTIANLTSEAEIKIYDVAGELVRTLPYTSANGQATWDGKNDGGNQVASGVYLAFIKSPQGKKTMKIAVEK